MKGTPIITFFIGMLVGAAIALLYAPASGEEIRDELRRERKRALDELDKATAELRESMAETRGQLAAYVEQAKSHAEEAEG